MPEKEQNEKTDDILGNFPNTYTFTKSNAERYLKKLRKKVPILICRPSIIGASKDEPAPGWIDSLAAAAGYVHGLCTGLVNHMEGDPNAILDVIPVDYVCNGLLMGTCMMAGQDKCTVMHLTSS